MKKTLLMIMLMLCASVAFADQRSDFTAASPELRATVVKAQLMIIRKTATLEQQELLDRIIPTIDAEMYEKSPEFESPLADEVRKLFPADERFKDFDPMVATYLNRAVGVNLSGSSCDSDSIYRKVSTTDSSFRSCSCSIDSDFCGYMHYCYYPGANMCSRTKQGCGFLWQWNCDGWCAIYGG